MSEGDIAILRERLDNVMDKLNAMRVDQNARLDEIKAKQDITNGRVTKLEKFKLIAITALVVLSVGKSGGLITLIRMAGL